VLFPLPSISDRFDRHICMTLGSLICMAGVAVCTATESQGAFVAGHILLGIGSVVVAAIGPVWMVALAYPSQRATATAMSNTTIVLEAFSRPGPHSARLDCSLHGQSSRKERQEVHTNVLSGLRELPRSFNHCPPLLSLSGLSSFQSEATNLTRKKQSNFILVTSMACQPR
jgi:multisubunit Na+/H+ antiporter MnhG subunit